MAKVKRTKKVEAGEGQGQTKVGLPAGETPESAAASADKTGHLGPLGAPQTPREMTPTPSEMQPEQVARQPAPEAAETGKAALPETEPADHEEPHATARERPRPAGEPPPEADQLYPEATPPPIELAPEIAGPPPGPKETGKAALPDWDEDDADEADETEVHLTAQDEEDFWRLDAQVDTGLRESLTALREIRRRKLFRAVKDAEGKPIYRSFDRYLEDHKGHTRQWVTQGTNWLRAREALDHLGIPVPLTVDAAQGLEPGRVKEAGGYLAVLTEAQEDGLPVTKDHLREVVKRRADYAFWSKPDSPRKPAAPTYQDYKQDLQMAQRLGGRSLAVLPAAKQRPGDLTENVIRVATEKRVIPAAEDLVQVATGPALEALVNRLSEVAETKAKLDLLATRKKEIRAMLQEDGLKALKAEAKALEAELTAKGVLKKKGKASSDPQPDEGDDPEDKNTGGEDGEANEVLEHLDEARQALASALDAEWPQDHSQLRAILAGIEAVKDKLDELTGKAKELLAEEEAAEPETITRQEHQPA